MKYFFFAFLLTGISAAAQKRSNVFLAAEMLNQSKGLSLAYNHQVLKSKLGVGGSIDFIDISMQRLDGIMPSLDVRYYIPAGRSTFIPIAQGGFNVVQQNIVDSFSGEHYSYSGRESFAVGMGYAYKLVRNGGGPFMGLKYRRIHYAYLMNNPPEKNYIDGLKLSVGWRF
jgi:hypothetical protein